MQLLVILRTIAILNSPVFHAQTSSATRGGKKDYCKGFNHSLVDEQHPELPGASFHILPAEKNSP